MATDSSRRKPPRRQIPRFARSRWTGEQLDWLREQVELGTATKLLAAKLGRSESAVRRRAGQERISLGRTRATEVAANVPPLPVRKPRRD